MGFVIGLVALIVAFFTFQQRYNDNVFNAYVHDKIGHGAEKWRVLLWVAVGFSTWAMVTFVPVPAYVALMFFLAVWVVWLSSPAGNDFIKKLV